MPALAENLLKFGIMLIVILILLRLSLFRVGQPTAKKVNSSKIAGFQAEVAVLNMRIIELMAEIEALERRVKQLEDEKHQS